MEDNSPTIYTDICITLAGGFFINIGILSHPKYLTVTVTANEAVKFDGNKNNPVNIVELVCVSSDLNK